jgi:hypothetical protein
MGMVFVDGVLLLGFRKNAASEALDVDLLLVIDTRLSKDDDCKTGWF